MRDGFLKYKDKNKKLADKTLESDKERANSMIYDPFTERR